MARGSRFFGSDRAPPLEKIAEFVVELEYERGLPGIMPILFLDTDS